MSEENGLQEYEESLIRLVLIADRKREEKQLLKLDDQLKSDPAYAIPKLSNKQLKRIDKALHREHRRQFCTNIHVHRRALLALGCCIFVVLSVSAGVFGKDIANYIVEVHEKYISRTINPLETDYADYSGKYMPSYKPEGYMVANKKGDHGLTIITYRGPNENDRIHFEQSEKQINQYLDNEHALVINDLVIQDKPGQKLLYADGEITLIWGEQPYFLLSSTSVEESELLKMAESVMLVP